MALVPAAFEGKELKLLSQSASIRRWASGPHARLHAAEYEAYGPVNHRYRLVSTMAITTGLLPQR
jgi:hypothetical protein